MAPLDRIDPPPVETLTPIHENHLKWMGAVSFGGGGSILAASMGTLLSAIRLEIMFDFELFS